MRFAATAVLAVIAATSLAATGRAQPVPATINWTIDRISSPTSFQATFDWRQGRDHNRWSSTHRAAQFAGLDLASLRGRGGPVRFALRRPAGTFDCTGQGGGGRGRGACAFLPNADFARLLAAQGLASPTWRQSLSLALGNVDRPLVESLGKLRGLRPTIDQLTSMAVHGVGADLVDAAARARLPLASIDDLVSLRIHGANAEWISGLAPYAGQLRHLQGSDLVSLKVHGATPQWIGAVATAMGPQFARLSGDELTSMRVHAAKPEMIAAYRQTFGRPLSGGDITSMAIHGVSADFIRRVAGAGYRDVSAADLVSMRLHGIRRRDGTD